MPQARAATSPEARPVGRAADDLPAVRSIDAARVWDTAVVQRLDESGFVDALYR